LNKDVAEPVAVKSCGLLFVGNVPVPFTVPPGSIVRPNEEAIEPFTVRVAPDWTVVRPV
jgi:hypothetical protein